MTGLAEEGNPLPAPITEGGLENILDAVGVLRTSYVNPQAIVLS